MHLIARILLVGLGFAALLTSSALAAPLKDSKLETAGTAVAVALPLVAGGISLLHNADWDGVGELVVSTGITVGAALILKQIVRERRPDGSDFHSFPSETSALADASAGYLWDRYGWEYGVPATLASAFVGYTRTHAKRHHWYDVAASGAMAFAVNYAIVTRYHPNDRFSLAAEAQPDGIGLRFAMNF